MSTFTIDSENNIVAHAETPASADNQQAFTTEKELTKLAADWPAGRLIELWNSFAGVAPFDDLKPVKKFTNRKVAVRRVWQAVARLSAAVAPQAEPVAPPEEEATKVPAKSKKRRTARKVADEAYQQEGRSDRDDETRERRDAGRNHGGHGLAEAHGPGVRQHPGQQGRREDRIGEELVRGADLQDREVASAPKPSKRRPEFPRAAFLLCPVA
jgi:hypothetical protein